MEQQRRCQLATCQKILSAQASKNRRYCCNAHKAQAHRQRQASQQEAQLRASWSVLPLESRTILEQILAGSGQEVAALAFRAIRLSYRNNDNVFKLLRHFSREQGDLS
jgi:hypothetical protein